MAAPRTYDWSRYLWVPSRPVVRLVSFLVMLSAAALVILVLISPGQFHIGVVRVSLRSGRNPTLLLAIAWVVWYLSAETLPGATRRLRAAMLGVWKTATPGRKVWMTLVVAEFILLVQTWLGYPEHVVALHRWALMNRTEPTREEGGDQLANIDYFSAICRRELPADARVLYHGHIEGLVFAYEVYPRRVFMLPKEYYDIARSWHKQRWLAGMPNDRLEAFWTTDYPTETIDRETFIKEHGITHEAWFDEETPTACQWRKIR